MQHPCKKKIWCLPEVLHPVQSWATPPPPTPYNLQQMFHDPSLSQSRFCSDFCILIWNIAQNFHCACATNLWMHALFTAECQHPPNYFLIFQSSSAFLLLVLALSRLVVEKHKLFKSLERQWKRKGVHMIMILLFCYHHNFSFLE